VTLEYDERNSYLLCVTVVYNRRQAANQALVFSSEDLRAKVMADLSSMHVWDVNGECPTRPAV
jgi:hypothetical protein